MALPFAQTNLVGCNASSITDLGLQASYASGATVTSNASFVSAGVPITVLVCATLSSGGATVKVDRHAGTPDWDSPTKTLTLTGTTPQYAHVDTTLAEPYVSVRVTDANWSCAFSELAVLGLGLVGDGKAGQFNIQNGLNACVSDVNGSGTGVFSLAPL
jgi:hypothetical protein